MRTTLNFEDKSTKELLSKLDFEYFLNQDIENENYSPENISEIKNEYLKNKQILKNKSRKKRLQFYFYIEGQVRKMFTGGFLPALFHLDESRDHTIIDFKSVGDAWAYFECWRNLYKKKLFKEKIWNYTIRIGSLLAFILTGLKLYEFLMK